MEYYKKIAIDLNSSWLSLEMKKDRKYLIKNSNKEKQLKMQVILVKIAVLMLQRKEKTKHYKVQKKEKPRI